MTIKGPNRAVIFIHNQKSSERGMYGNSMDKPPMVKVNYMHVKDGKSVNSVFFNLNNMSKVPTFHFSLIGKSNCRHITVKYRLFQSINKCRHFSFPL